MTEDRLLNPVQVRYSDDGSFIYVSINPREVLQQRLGAEDILEALLETGFSSFEYQLEQETLDELIHLPWNRLNRVIVRRIAYRVEFDLKVTFSSDRMEAFVSVKPAFAQEQISRERLLERLSHAGVKSGLIEEALRLVLTVGEANQIKVAQGCEPEHGRDSWLEFLCPTLDADRLPLVEPGMPLVRRHPPTSGSDGFRVSGQILPARPGVLMGLIPGDGCELDPGDPHLLRATLQGVPLIQGQHVRVDPLLEVDASQPLETFYLHSLRIQGAIETGVRLHCAGHVIVEGPVYGGELVAEGDLVLREPVLGPVWLQSGGDMHLLSARHALIRCGRHLRLQMGLVHSQAFISGECLAPAAEISGGALHCLHGAVLAEIGSPGEEQTLLQLGSSAYFLEALYSLQTEAQDLRRQLEEVLRQLIRQRSLGEAAEVGRLQQRQQALRYRDLSLRAEIDVMLRALDADACVEARIFKALHTGVSIGWQEQTLTLAHTTVGAAISCRPEAMPELLPLNGPPTAL